MEKTSISQRRKERKPKKITSPEGLTATQKADFLDLKDCYERVMLCSCGRVYGVDGIGEIHKMCPICSYKIYGKKSRISRSKQLKSS